MSQNEQIICCQQAAAQMRKDILWMTYEKSAGGAHIAPALSIADILAVLYTQMLPKPGRSKTATFVLSKGHAAMAQYAALCAAGYITRQQLADFEQNGSDFPSHPAKNPALGIDFSGGSLGMGLPYAAGLALAAKMKEEGHTVYTLLGDGECNEGMVWEGVFFAAQHKLPLVAIIDQNGMQSDGETGEISALDLSALFAAARWQTAECDGHDHGALLDVFQQAGRLAKQGPVAIFAHTVKGRGVSFMENNNEWHRNRLTKEQYETALAEIERA